MSTPDRYFLGSQMYELNNEKEKEDLINRLRQYLELRNVSVLIGNGASLPLGAPSISSIKDIAKELEAKPYTLDEPLKQKAALGLLKVLLDKAHKSMGLESFLGLLSNILSEIETLPSHFTIKINDNTIDKDSVKSLESLLKKWIYIHCDELSLKVTEEDLSNHKELLRRFLLRSTSLPRLKVFTTNYDLLIERALDDLGISYFDGFIGTIKRTLSSESYHYDLYFPGETTEGRVSRVDRVVQLYKLHGSINWRRRPDGCRFDVVMEHSKPQDSEFGEVMIYPSPLKVTEMHGYPYSEMFRNFAASIHQPQSVLFTLGYSFKDDHINRIIYQALSIPSFVLVIVIPEVIIPNDENQLGPEHEVWRLINRVNSKRILVLTGGKYEDGKGFVSGAGTLKDFANEWMPDIKELAIMAKVKEEAQKAFDISLFCNEGEQ